MKQLFLFFLSLGSFLNLYAQDFGFKEIDAPFQDNHVMIELYGMIYEPGHLTGINLSVSVDENTFEKAKSVYILFPKGKEFHHGNVDSLMQIGIQSAKFQSEDWTAYKLTANFRAFIDDVWLRDARGELYFYLLWDAMADKGELESKKVSFKVEADFKYKDEAILTRSGIEGVYTDPRDQKKYKIVTIGDATWMKDNLRYHAAFSKKKNDVVELTDNGLLYSWWNARKACPQGWKLPDESDFMYLKSYYENERHLIPGGISSLDLQSIFYDTFWEYWTSSPNGMGYIITYKFEWQGLEQSSNKAGGSYAEVGEWAKSLIRCIKDDGSE